jgi:transposase InsO family protein
MMCEKYKVSRSGFYAWQRRPASARIQANAALSEHIREVHTSSHEAYGSPRIYAALQQQGIACGRHRVAQLMRSMGLAGRASRLYWSNAGNHAFFQRHNNEKLRMTAPNAINQLWVGDVTFLKTGNGWQYLAVVMDMVSRRIIGWALASHRRAALTCEALQMAIAVRKPTSGLWFHSDRGIEYAALEYQALLMQYGIKPSMNRPGQCTDNAHMESFFHSFKSEWIHGFRFRGGEDLKVAIQQYIEGFYNPVRLHSGIGYQSPMTLEAAG